MTKKIDPDILVLRRCHKAILNSTSRRMMRANVEWLYGHFVSHPSPELSNWKPSSTPSQSEGTGEEK